MRTSLFVLLVILATLPTARVSAEEYGEQLARMRVDDASIRGRVDAGHAKLDVVGKQVRASIEELFDAWEGTKWGLGLPQTDVPGEGKINCGTFVGTVLVHAGFVVDHRKLQRQPSELIIKTMSPPDQIERFRNTSMEEFLEGVRAMGEGLYIIGLDYHVGFLAVEKDEPVRFIHAGVYPEEVVDEPAKGAREIDESRYRVVGKILQPNMLRAWVDGDRIAVRGNW